MKILLYDIETMAELGWYFPPRYEANIMHVEHPEHLLTVAHKWLDERTVHVKGIDDFPGYKKNKHDDKALVEYTRQLFDEADIVIAHNGNNFDQKMVNARIMTHHLTPPSPYHQIDTRTVVRRYARFASNKLDELGRQLELGQKLQHGNFRELWLASDQGDEKALAVMKRYNKQDVRLLEQLYLELRPWIRNHPSMNLMEGKLDKCPNCGEGPLRKHGVYRTRVSRFQVYNCKACGAFPRRRVADKTLKPEFV